MAGWIKIDRSILNHWIWQDEKYYRWWMTILLLVNYEAKKFPVNGEIFICNPGESFRSIEEWGHLFGCAKKTVFKFFDLLKNDEMITTKTVGSGNRRKHLLTVVNWQKYQQTETEKDTERKPETTPKGNPNKNIKKENKEKNKEKNNISDIFEQFRLKYPGTKRGLEIEFENFIKKNNPEIVNQLLPALEKEIENKVILTNLNLFCPNWKNLSTWINQKCWEQELPEIVNTTGTQTQKTEKPFQYVPDWLKKENAIKAN